MNAAKHFLFLYTRLPDYFYQCICHLVRTAPEGSAATIFVYPPDPNAPYSFVKSAGVSILEKSALASFDAEKNPPSVIYCAGWGDKEYGAFARKWISRVPVITGLDNPWKGTIRQKIASFVAPILLSKKTSHLWVTGYPQFEFATKLGFGANKILRGLYCADINKFRNPGVVQEKRIVFVGRMVDYKRPHWLAQAFTELQEEYEECRDWELLMIGSGPLKNEIENKFGGHGGVKMIEFVQPSELAGYYHRSLVFCLPSFQEHWGVVVQEAAAAGMALLLTDNCGAASEFLINGYNGYSFNSTDIDDLKNKLRTLLLAPTDHIRGMGERSMQLSERISQDSWAGTIRSVLNNDSE